MTVIHGILAAWLDWGWLWMLVGLAGWAAVRFALDVLGDL